MPAYEYTALDPSGRERSGVMEGDSARQIRAQLREQGMLPVSVSEVVDTAPTRLGRFSLAGRIGAMDLALLTRQLATLVWVKPPTKIKDVSFNKADFRIRWYEDGELNASFNCIDRHLPERANDVAIIWEGDDPSEDRRITYGELYGEVCRMANILKARGVKRGDRVIVYMPMIPEAAYAMLACARIGAVHSVVFGGFSPDSLASRIDDCKPTAIITADEGLRGAKKIPLKRSVDAALAKTDGVRLVLVVRGTGGAVDVVKGRDLWWHEARDDVPPDCQPEVINAEAAENGTNGTAVARARLDGMQLADVTVIFRQQPKVASGHHFGSRLVFARDGSLFVTLGERNKERASAQDLGTHIGKIVRIGKDGTVPPDNPFVGRNDGAVCTSSNAQAVLEWAFRRKPRVLFFPDQHLGRNTGWRMGIPLERMPLWDPSEEFGGVDAAQVRDARILLWKGHCSVHARFTPEMVDRRREQMPGVKVIVHPECRSGNAHLRCCESPRCRESHHHAPASSRGPV